MINGRIFYRFLIKQIYFLKKPFSVFLDAIGTLGLLPPLLDVPVSSDAVDPFRLEPPPTPPPARFVSDDAKV
jgi:hypothetical protein